MMVRRFIAMLGLRRVRPSSDGLCHEIAPAAEVVRGGAEAKLPVDEASSPMPEFAQESHGLQPAEGLLDQFSLALTHGIARMARGPAIDRAPAGAGVLGHVRRDAHPSHRTDPRPPVIQLVG